MKRPTMADVARRAGVSKVAVFYALNGRPGVSQAARERIVNIAREPGFSPNNAARALTGASARAVGLVVCRPAHTLNDVRIPVLQQLQLPAVVIGGPGDTGDVAQLWSDDAKAMREAVRYLVALGHRRIAHVSGFPRLLHTQARIRGFVDSTTELGLGEAVTLEADYTGEEARRITRRLLIGAARPTAIIYDNDVMAVAGLAVARKMRLSLPAELSIVAWDDSLLCELVHPPLTALTRDIVGYGEHAARAIFKAIEGEPVDSVEGSAAHLTPRGSTAPPT